jgi:hypothetical protein
VVVDGPLDPYPRAYWGQLGGPGAKDKSIRWAWTAEDRDRITYAAHTTYNNALSMVLVTGRKLDAQWVYIYYCYNKNNGCLYSSVGVLTICLFPVHAANELSHF